MQTLVAVAIRLWAALLLFRSLIGAASPKSGDYSASEFLFYYAATIVFAIVAWIFADTFARAIIPRRSTDVVAIDARSFEVGGLRLIGVWLAATGLERMAVLTWSYFALTVDERVAGYAMSYRNEMGAGAVRLAIGVLVFFAARWLAGLVMKPAAVVRVSDEQST
jgi:hypothetical protein